MQLTSITKLELNSDNKNKDNKNDLILKLKPLFESQGKFFRTVFNYLYWHPVNSKEMMKLWKQFCSIQYLHDNGYCFGTKYANSLFQDAKTKVKLHQEEKSFRLKDIEDKIVDLNKVKQKLENELQLYQKKKAFIYHNKETFLKTKQQLYWLNRKLEKLASQQKKLTVSGVTFGTKSYQRKLSLKQTTKEAWQRKRNNFIYAIGRSERKSGNDCVDLIKNENNYYLKIELDRKLEKVETGNNKNKILAKDKQYVLLPITFQYLEKEINSTHKKTYRILWKKKKTLELHTTIELQKNIEPKNIKLGVDFNYGHLDYYLNNDCNGTITFQMFEEVKEDCVKKQISLPKEQRKQNLRLAIKQICLIAKEKNASIYIEDLNFNRKKNKLRKTNKNNKKEKFYNTMLSNLPYSQYQQMFEIEGYKQGIFVKKVNPAFSSQDALKQGLDRHLGAAKMIVNKD